MPSKSILWTTEYNPVVEFCGARELEYFQQFLRAPVNHPLKPVPTKTGRVDPHYTPIGRSNTSDHRKPSAKRFRCKHLESRSGVHCNGSHSRGDLHGALLATASGSLRSLGWEVGVSIIQPVTEKPSFCRIRKHLVKGSGHSSKRFFILFFFKKRFFKNKYINYSYKWADL